MVHDEKGAIAIILGKMKPKHDAEEHMEEHPDEALHACADDLIEAVHAKDVEGVTKALKAFFHIADAMPHEEGEHISEEEEHGEY